MRALPRHTRPSRRRARSWDVTKSRRCPCSPTLYEAARISLNRHRIPSPRCRNRRDPRPRVRSPSCAAAAPQAPPRPPCSSLPDAGPRRAARPALRPHAGPSRTGRPPRSSPQGRDLLPRGLPTARPPLPDRPGPGAPTLPPRRLGGFPEEGAGGSPQSAHLSGGLFSSRPPGRLDTGLRASLLGAAHASIPLPPRPSPRPPAPAPSNPPRRRPTRPVKLRSAARGLRGGGEAGPRGRSRLDWLSCALQANPRAPTARALRRGAVTDWNADWPRAVRWSSGAGLWVRHRGRGHGRAARHRDAGEVCREPQTPGLVRRPREQGWVQRQARHRRRPPRPRATLLRHRSPGAPETRTQGPSWRVRRGPGRA